jgi:hypothetical protein
MKEGEVLRRRSEDIELRYEEELERWLVVFGPHAGARRAGVLP